MSGFDAFLGLSLNYSNLSFQLISHIVRYNMEEEYMESDGQQAGCSREQFCVREKLSSCFFIAVFSGLNYQLLSMKSSGKSPPKHIVSTVCEQEHKYIFAELKFELVHLKLA